MTRTVPSNSPPHPGTASGPVQPPYLAAAGAFAVILALYVVTIAPTTQFWDTSEYIAAAKVLGIPHPPGNPLFVLIANVWGMLPLSAHYALRINLLAAATTAAAAGFLFLVAERMLASTTVLPRRLRLLPGGGGGVYGVEPGHREREDLHHQPALDHVRHVAGRAVGGPPGGGPRQIPRADRLRPDADDGPPLGGSSRRH